MFCNKYSPVPVCCESVSTKKQEKNEVEQTKEQKQEQQPKQEQEQKQPESEYKQASFSDKKKERLETITTVVNRDMSLDGECTLNSVIVLNDKGYPIICDQNQKCPLVILFNFNIFYI